MAVFNTYQNDTIRQNIQQNNQLLNKNLDVPRKPVSILQIQERTVVEKPQETQKKYTPQQIRNWRWKQENKLLIDDSRYIKPRSDVELSYTETPEVPVILPVREKNTPDTDWITIVLFTAILMFATIRYSYIKYISHLFLSLFNYPTSLRMFSEKNYPVSHAAYRLDVIFYLSFSLFVYQATVYAEIKSASASFLYFTLVLGFVLGYFFLKKFIYSMLGVIFKTQGESSEYLFNIDSFNRTLGLILLPVIALISFSPAEKPIFFIFSGLVLVITFNIVLLQRGISILLKKQFSIIYLFLYLCTLEFLPLLLIYKVVVE